MYIVTGETRSAGCLCNSSGWFKHSEPQRTYSNHNITELARCGELATCGEVFHLDNHFIVLYEDIVHVFSCTPCFPCNAVEREGSVQSNHPERR